MLNQHEFESAIYKTLAYGDETEIAKASGKSVGYYSQMFNPEDPRESIWFRAAVDFANLIAINKDRGCDALALFNSFIESSCPCSDAKLSLDIETVKGIKEDADVQVAFIENKPLYEQLLEVTQAIDQKKLQKKAIIAAINAEKETGNGGRSRLSRVS